MAHVDKTYFLQGKVGEKTVALKIKCYYESPVRYMNYFFEDDKMDCYLEGNLIGNTWQFTSIDNQKEEINLVIKEDQDGSWKGYWREGSGKKIKVVLKPILVDPDSKYFYFSQNKEFDLYDAYKISILSLDKIKTEKVSKNFALDWYLEKGSGITFFRLHNKNQKIILDSINNTLENLQLTLIHDYFHLNPNRESLNIQTEILYFNEELISFKLIENKPIKTQSPFKTQNQLKTQQLISLDLHNGQQIDLEKIVWFDEKNEKPDKNNISQIYEYRKKVFAPKIFSILNELYPQRIKSSDCDLDKESTWTLPDFALTKQGLLFSFSNSTICNFMDWAIIPYEKLAPYLEKKYILN